MGLLGRLWGKRRSGGPADDSLPFMSEDEAAEIRSLMASEFARRGLEVAVHPAHVQDDAGRQFGLWNVAATCHQDPAGRRAWPRLVRGHVERVLDSMSEHDPFDDLTPEQVRRQCYLRLYDPESLPGLEPEAMREFAPGIVQLLALDLPHAVVSFSPEQVDRFGGWEILGAQAHANLDRLPVEESELVEGDDGARLRLLWGDSMFTASRVTSLPTLAVEMGDPPASSYGWLMAVPHRHQCLWHIITGVDMVPSLNAMAHLAASGYSDAPGSISPHVYWWDGSRYHQLTRIDEEGTISVAVGTEFQDLLERLVDETGEAT